MCLGGKEQGYTTLVIIKWFISFTFNWKPVYNRSAIDTKHFH